MQEISIFLNIFQKVVIRNTILPFLFVKKGKYGGIIMKNQEVQELLDVEIPKGNSKKQKGQKKKMLGMNSRIRTVVIKCYDEQMPTGWKDVQKRIKKFPKSNAHIIAIRHDRDEFYENDFWESSKEKPHYHIVFLMQGHDNSGNKNRIYLHNVFEILGIVFRKEDVNLWKNRGVETVAHVPNKITYLTHDTEEAILDGKAQYELYELVSNLTIEEIETYRNEYFAQPKKRQKSLFTKAELSAYDEIAYQLGLQLQDYNEWYATLPFGVRDNSSIKTIEKRYFCGLQQRIHGAMSQMTRLCVYIQGEPNTGKTYASEKALTLLGQDILQVVESGTGKFDDLKATTGAIIVDDATIPNLLNMSDNKICKAYKRNANNPYWCGQYLIVTSNNPFDVWLDMCGSFSDKNKEAIKSRFFICRLETNENGETQLYCESPSERGTAQDIERRGKLYVEFGQKFNETIKQYNPTKKEKPIIDYNALVSPTITEEYLNAKDPEYDDKLSRTEQNKRKAFLDYFNDTYITMVFHMLLAQNQITYACQKEVYNDHATTPFIANILDVQTKQKIVDTVLQFNRANMSYDDCVYSCTQVIHHNGIRHACADYIQEFINTQYAYIETTKPMLCDIGDFQYMFL